MKRKLLLLLFILCLLPATNVWAQTGTYTANGVTWKYKLEGSPKTATITGEVLGRTAFSGALNIPDDIVHGGTHYTVTKIGQYAFQSYVNATVLSIPESVTTIEKRAFYGLSKAEGVLSLPNVTTIEDYAFYTCWKLTSLSLPKVTIIGENAFGACRRLTGSLILPEVLSVGEEAFRGCSGFNGSIEMPKVTTIGPQAFYSCENVTGHLLLPNVTTIENEAFENCKKLTQLSIPKIIRLGYSCFEECRFTGVLSLPASLKEIASRVFYNAEFTAIIFASGTVLTKCGGFSFNNKDLSYIDMRGVTFPAGTDLGRYGGVFNGVLQKTICYVSASAPPVMMGPGPSGTSYSQKLNIVRGNVCDSLVIYDYTTWLFNDIKTNYPIKYPFTAIKATYNRVLSGVTCKTLYLPYPATLPDGMRAYTLEAKTTHLGITHFRFTSVGDGGTQLQANKPYLVRIIDGSASKQFGTDVNVQVPVTPPIASTEVQDVNGQGFYFGGTTENIDNATAAGMKAYNLINNQWRPIRTDNPNGYIHSFRAYMRTTGAAPAKGFAIVLDDEDTPTGIDDTVAEDAVEQGNSPIYTLDGKLMGTDIDALPSGEIYIKNGKKFYKF